MATLRRLRGVAVSIAVFLVLALLPSASYAQQQLDAIYSFGDSLADTGNLVRQGPLGQFAPIESLPYGTSLGKATGRCSDGLLMIDYIAEHFGLPHLNPYWDRHASFDKGANFAVAGSTALDVSDLNNRGFQVPFTNSSLDVQLSWFESYANTTCSSQSDCKAAFSNSLFMLGEIGGNDYNIAFSAGNTIEDVTKLVPSVVQSIIKAARKLINLGATNLMVPGNFPIGCLPVYLTMFQSNDGSNYDVVKCLAKYNNFAEVHNQQLQDALKSLSEEFPDVKIKYVDTYDAHYHFVEDAVAQGSKNILTACCGTGGKYNFNPGDMCNSETSVCDDLSSRINWDGLHLTQHAYKEIVDYLILAETFE